MRTFLRICIAAIGAIAIGWLLQRIWKKSFYTVEIEKVAVNNRVGAPCSGRRVRVQSIFDAQPEAIWAKVMRPALLAFVARPLLTFHPQQGAFLPDAWHEGDSLHLHLAGLGFIPLGAHTIHIERIDAERMEILSRESGQVAETWVHRIALQLSAGDRTLYTDEIDIYAGWRTGAVACFAQVFYCYRQTRWRSIVNTIQ